MALHVGWELNENDGQDFSCPPPVSGILLPLPLSGCLIIPLCRNCPDPREWWGYRPPDPFHRPDLRRFPCLRGIPPDILNGTASIPTADHTFPLFQIQFHNCRRPIPPEFGFPVIQDGACSGLKELGQNFLCRLVEDFRQIIHCHLYVHINGSIFFACGDRRVYSHTRSLPSNLKV